jgi:hypothetical protein
VATAIGAGNVATATGKVAGQITNRTFRHDDLDIDDGLQHNRLGARIASITALRPAITKATSLPSTACVLPSKTVTFRSSTA